jgi:hypothetical protein
MTMSPSILEVTPPMRVTVTGNDYIYQGWLAGLVIKRNGAIRYVVEDDNGRLFIHNAKQLGKQEGWVP